MGEPVEGNRVQDGEKRTEWRGVTSVSGVEMENEIVCVWEVACGSEFDPSFLWLVSVRLIMTHAHIDMHTHINTCTHT